MRTTRLILLCIAAIAFHNSVKAQSSYTWNGTTSSDWGTSTNWTPNGTPGALDTVTIVSGTNDPVYDGVATVIAVIMTSDTLDLGGDTLEVTGDFATFNGGVITNGWIKSTATNTTFAGTQFNCQVRATTANLLLNGSTFNDTTLVEQNGSSQTISLGGNTFNEYTEIIHNGSGRMYLDQSSSYSDTANADIVFTKKGSERFYIAHAGSGIYLAGKTTVNYENGASGVLYFSTTATTTFDGDIEINNPGGGEIRIGDNPSSDITLKDGHTLSIGSGGFSSNILQLENFVQEGNTPQNIQLDGSSLFTIPNSDVEFNGPVTITAGRIALEKATFNNTAFLETVGTGTSSCSGGNVFELGVTVSKTNTGNWEWGNVYPDTFKTSLNLINRAGNDIRVGRTVAGTLINCNLNVKNTGVGNICLGYDTNGEVELGSGYTITSDTFSSGSLQFKNFTQNGTTDISFDLENSADLIINSNSTFNGNMTVSAPDVFLNGGTFNGKASITKTAGDNNLGQGGNVFNDTTIIISDGTGYLATANLNPDTFNAPVTFDHRNDRLYVAYKSTGNLFSDKVYVRCTGSADYAFFAREGTATFKDTVYVGNNTLDKGIYFGYNGIDSVLFSDNGIIAIDTMGFANGRLFLHHVGQNNNTKFMLFFEGATQFIMDTTIIEGPFFVTSPSVNIDRVTFNDTAYIQKTGAGTDFLEGNIFNNKTFLSCTHTTDDLKLAGAVNGNDYNDDVWFHQTDSAVGQVVWPANKSASTFAGDITVIDSYYEFRFGRSSSHNGKVILDGNKEQKIRVENGSIAKLDFRNLQVSKSDSNVVFETSAEIYDSLIFDNGLLITTDSTQIALLDTTEYYNASDSSHVQGTLEKYGAVDFIFPMGEDEEQKPIKYVNRDAINTDTRIRLEKTNTDDQWDYTIQQ